MMQEKECTDIWRRYQAGKDHHNRTNMYTQAEKCHRFYEGDQWHGLQAGDEELPMLNFIKPICRYKIVMVAMNDTAILFSPMDNDPKKAEICEALTAFAAAQWEKGKLDSKKWAVVKNACITGDHYLYCFDERTPSESVVTDMTPRLKMRLIDKTALYLADEQEPNLAYSVRGLRLADGTLLPHAELEALDIDIKIDISPIDPYSVLSRELSLENALAQQHITFEEYVEALDDNSGVPKDKFRAILDRRRGAAPEQSESGAGQNIGPGGAAGAFSPEKALPGMELAGGGVPGGLPGAGMPVQGGAGLFPGMGPAMA